MKICSELSAQGKLASKTRRGFHSKGLESCALFFIASTRRCEENRIWGEDGWNAAFKVEVMLVLWMKLEILTLDNP